MPLLISVDIGIGTIDRTLTWWVALEILVISLPQTFRLHLMLLSPPIVSMIRCIFTSLYIARRWRARCPALCTVLTSRTFMLVADVVMVTPWAHRLRLGVLVRTV